ncbi:deoxyguanosinetriphosphate triphosphohydrolase [Alphaproteobacteria bacterium]|nr:deoxyguanosinetriphosphate triphosphohydrolase [Alphaproteobacteria bacterium]
MSEIIETRHIRSCACHSPQSKGRYYKDQPLTLDRTEYQRDRDRIIHSEAFRRLKHKTQVFIYQEGDHYRTRLTHTLEVAQIARSIARSLKLNEDLAETISLAHDLGHPPLGHKGEEILNKLMINAGGFDHNEQTIRVITLLEKKYPNFEGLNLTFETLEGLVKHNGPYRRVKEIPATIKNINKNFDLKLSLFPSLEAQVSNISDDVAYLTHDLDDGLRENLFNMEDLQNLKLPNLIIKKIKEKYAPIDKGILTHQLIRGLISFFINDIVTNSLHTLDKYNFKSVDDIRLFETPIILMTLKTSYYMKELREFLFKNMYHEKNIINKLSKASIMIEKLFLLYKNDVRLLPKKWRFHKQEDLLLVSDNIKSRVVGDYIAGMTDIFLRAEYRNHFNMKENYL